MNEVAVPAVEFPRTLMSLWLRNREGTRPIGEIVTDARAGKLPGVEPLKSGFGFAVIDEAAALAAMKV
jgi:hypothetical protein